ncbi:3-dehydroquinate synthase [Spatholobus suberectus]|nr:3-dehydroquinate synthase [Spatholobus suberectus]
MVLMMQKVRPKGFVDFMQEMVLMMQKVRPKEYFVRRVEESNLQSLTKATVTHIQVVKMVDRICVDLSSLMKPGLFVEYRWCSTYRYGCGLVDLRMTHEMEEFGVVKIWCALLVWVFCCRFGLCRESHIAQSFAANEVGCGGSMEALVFVGSMTLV